MDIQCKLLGHHLVSGVTEFRLIRSFDGAVRQKFVKNPLSPDVSEQTHAANLGGYDLYVGINPRDVGGGSATDVSYITCVVFDIDPIRKKGDVATNEQLTEAIEHGKFLAESFSQEFQCTTVVAQSGSGCHIYVPIKPMKATKENLEPLKVWYKKIVDDFSTETLKLDMIYDTPRVIRVWGSTNTKNGRVCGYLVEYGGEDEVHRLDLEKILGTIAVPSASKVSVTVGSTHLDGRFNSVAASEPVLMSCMQKTATYPSRSEADYAFIGKLVEAGFNKDEIKLLAKKNPLGRGVEIKEADVERIVEKFVNNGIKVKATTTYVDKYLSSLKSRKRGMPTGFDKFDMMTGGQRPGEITIIAGRPSDGKSTLTTQIAYNMATEGRRVLIFPTELSASVVYDKMMALITGIDLTKFRDGSFTSAEIKEIETAQPELEKLPLFVCEDFSLNTKEIEKRVKQIQPEVVILDYIQAMAYPEGGSPKEISASIGCCAELAGTYKIPFIVASQLSRPSEVSNISMNHLKGSGALEEKASIIGALVTLDKLTVPRPVDLHVLKSRYGETGKVELSFDPARCMFSEGR